MFGRKTVPRWFYPSCMHLEAINRAIYVAESGAGMAVVSGQDGTGRSTVLGQLHAELKRRNYHVAMVNASAMDQHSLLFHIADQLSICLPEGAQRSDILLRIRDELQGQAHCGVRTVLLLDDLHRGQMHFQEGRTAGNDLVAAVQYFCALGAAASGMISVIITCDRQTIAGLSATPALNIPLSTLSFDESIDFTTSLLRSLASDLQFVDESAVAAVAETADGFPGMLIRLCELIQIVHETSPRLKIDEAVVREMVTAVLPRFAA